jgi:DNA-binding XRE family transcriptional regulator
MKRLNRRAANMAARRSRARDALAGQLEQAIKSAKPGTRSLMIAIDVPDAADMITAAQIRGARAMLDMCQAEVAGRARISIPTLKRLEAGDGPLKGTYETVAASISVLEAAGIVFTNGEMPGVKLKQKP